MILGKVLVEQIQPLIIVMETRSVRNPGRAAFEDVVNNTSLIFGKTFFASVPFCTWGIPRKIFWDEHELKQKTFSFVT